MDASNYRRFGSRIGASRKHDGHLERNVLKGSKGDVINVLLCAIGHNLRLLLAWFRKLLLLILAAMLIPTSTAKMRVA